MAVNWTGHEGERKGNRTRGKRRASAATLRRSRCIHRGTGRRGSAWFQILRWHSNSPENEGERAKVYLDDHFGPEAMIHAKAFAHLEILGRHHWPHPLDRVRQIHLGRDGVAPTCEEARVCQTRSLLKRADFPRPIVRAVNAVLPVSRLESGQPTCSIPSLGIRIGPFTDIVPFDVRSAAGLIGKPPKAARVLADIAYDSDKLHEFLIARGSTPVTKANPTRKKIPPFDKASYKGRNVIERAFSHLKDWRRVATRYDRLARNFAALFRCQFVASAWTTNWPAGVHTAAPAPFRYGHSSRQPGPRLVIPKAHWPTVFDISPDAFAAVAPPHRKGGCTVRAGAWWLIHD
jgi:transposase